MSGKQWLNLNKLATSAGLQILFDINGLVRFSNGTWNSSNAEELIEFSDRHNLNVIWQLGNEPDLYKSLYQYEVSAQQLAEDFTKLRDILNRSTSYKDTLLVGPDVTQPRLRNVKYFKYLKKFLKNSGNVIDAVTWHHYNLNGRKANETDFLNLETFNKLKHQIIMIQDILKEVGLSKTRNWLGETGSATGGGAPCISDRFIASFVWLDKLGVAARYGVDVVIRQALFKGYYALLEDNLTPLPDYWISVIYKQLVGPKVVPCNNNKNSTFVRLYCHCSKTQALKTNVTSITVFGINLNDTEVTIQLTGIAPVTGNISAYILTSDSNLLSKNLLLNNEVLKQLPNGDIPQFKPKSLEAHTDFKMPPLSLGFWVVPSSDFPFC